MEVHDLVIASQLFMFNESLYIYIHIVVILSPPPHTRKLMQYLLFIPSLLMKTQTKMRGSKHLLASHLFMRTIKKHVSYMFLLIIKLMLYFSLEFYHFVLYKLIGHVNINYSYQANQIKKDLYPVCPYFSPKVLLSWYSHEELDN